MWNLWLAARVWTQVLVLQLQNKERGWAFEWWRGRAASRLFGWSCELSSGLPAEDALVWFHRGFVRLWYWRGRWDSNQRRIGPPARALHALPPPITGTSCLHPSALIKTQKEKLFSYLLLWLKKKKRWPFLSCSPELQQNSVLIQYHRVNRTKERRLKTKPQTNLLVLFWQLMSRNSFRNKHLQQNICKDEVLFKFSETPETLMKRSEPVWSFSNRNRRL